MRNIRLLVAYDGTDFHGWQRQPGLATIQSNLETALEQIVAERVGVMGSGRTDAGVHALGQVANFKTTSSIPGSSLVKALNNLLPSTIRVINAEEVAESFHARYNARAKTYRYRILLAPIASPFVGRFVYHHPYQLNRERMEAAARAFEGEHDFTSFAAVSAVHDPPPRVTTIPSPAVGAVHEPPPLGTTSRGLDAGVPNPSPDPSSMTRSIFSSRLLWRPRTSMLVYEVQGSGFLHHMVRNIVGTLLEVGRGKVSPSDIMTILSARDRTRAGPTAPASGLCLIRVEY